MAMAMALPPCHGLLLLLLHPPNKNVAPPFPSRRRSPLPPAKASGGGRPASPSPFPRLRTEDRRRKLLLINASALNASSSAASVVENRILPLPFDYYQVLGVELHVPVDDIVRAYEEQIKSPPQEGFTQKALHARQEILKGACSTLADTDLRDAYNHSLLEDEAGALMVDIPWHKVQGALCLLQEVGEWGVVLQVGEEILRERLSKPDRCDVVLAMALSYVELSREAMAENPPAVARGYDMLEMASKLLQEAGSSLAPALQDQIKETLKQLRPRWTLGLLSLPLGKQYEVQREEGLKALRNALWATGEGGVFAPIPGFTREQFMREAFSQMKASEQVSLFNSTPINIPADSSEVYLAALAHIAEGFIGKKPQFILEADTLLSELQLSNAERLRSAENIPPADEKLGFLLERAMCALLLGEVGHCCTWLGLCKRESPYRDPSVIEFIYKNSKGGEKGGDYLPGLCRLLDSWLREVVFPSFRDTAGLQFKLGDYYDNPGVLAYLERGEKGSAISQLRAGAGAALDSLQKVFPTTKVVPGVKLGDNSRDGYSESVASASSNKPTSPPPIKNSPSHTSPKSDSPSESILDDKSGKQSGRITQDRSSPMAVLHSNGLTLLQLLSTGVALGVLALAGGRVLAPHSTLFRSQLGSSVPVNALSSQDYNQDFINMEGRSMDTKLAEHLVKRWQAAKAQALGPNHTLGQLYVLLDGQMLKIWVDRARDVAKNGWYWEYKLMDLKIDRITLSNDGKRAIVEATLHEAARLFGSSDPEQDSYLSTYTARYELLLIDRKWKFVNGAVLES